MVPDPSRLRAFIGACLAAGFTACPAIGDNAKKRSAGSCHAGFFAHFVWISHTNHGNAAAARTTPVATRTAVAGGCQDGGSTSFGSSKPALKTCCFFIKAHA
jgi:hypothetical protein